jgi:hypothetical protein
VAADTDRQLVAQLVEAAQRRHRAQPAGLQREPDRPVGEHADAVHHEVHRERVSGILRARKAGLDHREAGLHEHHEEAGDERPHEVDRDRVRRGGGVRRCGQRVRGQRGGCRRHALRDEGKRARQGQQQAETN